MLGSTLVSSRNTTCVWSCSQPSLRTGLLTAINLVHHVRRSAGQMRQIWLGVAATATGFGIWATHFIAMSLSRREFPAATMALTLLSLIAAIVPPVSGSGRPVADAARCRLVRQRSSAAASQPCTTPAWRPNQDASVGSGPGRCPIAAGARRRGYEGGLIEGERVAVLRCAASHRRHAATISRRWPRPSC